MGTYVNGIYQPAAGETGWDGLVNTDLTRLSELAFNVKAYGALGDGTTDDTAAIQNAIFAQQVSGGIVYVPPGTYLVSNKLVPAPAITNAAVATVPCIIRGAGMHASVIKQNQNFNANGLIGYSRASGTPVCAQVVMTDLCLDGNYSGVASGTVAQPSSGQGALVSLPTPYSVATSNLVPHAGIYHHFRRVRFYRAPGYTFQPSRSVDIRGCLFDRVGQPDVASGGLHWDNIGSGGYTDAIIIGNSWVGSSGNYADFIDAGVKSIRATFVNNVSMSHQIGGVYIGGNGSVIQGNVLVNTNVAGYVGYDSGTAAGLRSRNLCVGNRFVGLNLLTGAAVFSSGTYGDVVASNSANDV